MTNTVLTADTSKQFVPDGWFPLVDRLFGALPYFQEHYDNTVDAQVRQAYPTLEVTGVEVKNGKFFATFNFPFAPLMDFVRDLGEDSTWTCRECGSTAECLKEKRSNCSRTNNS